MRLIKTLLSAQLICACLALGMELLSTAQAAERPEYTVTRVGPASLDGLMWAGKINDRGDVLVQIYNSPNNSHPFIYREGVLQALDVPGNRVDGVDMNNNGEILCRIYGGGSPKAVVVLTNGNLIHLDEVVGSPFTPSVMNDLGDLAGDLFQQNFVYNFKTGARRFFAIDDLLTSNFWYINNQGQVLGYWYSEETATAGGTVFTGDGYFHFEIPGRQKQTLGMCINNKGVIGGNVFGLDSSSYYWRPFLYEAGHFTRLGTLPGDHYSAFAAMNDNGEVVGWSMNVKEHVIHPFIYRGTKMLNLNALLAPGSGWVLEAPTSINNKGQILGTGYFQGEAAVFLLTPIGK